MAKINEQELTRLQKIYRWVKIVSSALAIIGALLSGAYWLYTWHQNQFITVEKFQNYKDDREHVISNLRQNIDNEAKQTRKAVVRLARAWYKTQIDEIQADISALERKQVESGLTQFEQTALRRAQNRLSELQKQLDELPNETIID